MTDEQADKIIELLERIAKALEMPSLPLMPYAPTSSGFQCQKCWQWVPNGVTHYCGYRGSGNGFGLAGGGNS